MVMRFLTWGTCFILYILVENHMNLRLSVSMDWFARFSIYIYCPCIHIMQNFWTLWSLSTSQRRVPFSINGQTNKKKNNSLGYIPGIPMAWYNLWVYYMAGHQIYLLGYERIPKSTKPSSYIYISRSLRHWDPLRLNYSNFNQSIL